MGQGKLILMDTVENLVLNLPANSTFIEISAKLDSDDKNLIMDSYFLNTSSISEYDSCDKESEETEVWSIIAYVKDYEERLRRSPGPNLAQRKMAKDSVCSRLKQPTKVLVYKKYKKIRLKN